MVFQLLYHLNLAFGPNTIYFYYLFPKIPNNLRNHTRL